LSNLIKEDQKTLFEISVFRAEEIGPLEQPDHPDDENGQVELPVGKEPSLYPQDPPKVVAADDEVALEEGDAGDADDNDDADEAEKLAALEKEAYRKGFEQGQRDGLAIEEKQMADKARRLESLLTGLGGLKAQIVGETEKEFLGLAIGIAKCIVNAEVKIDPEAIERTVRAASTLVVDRSQIRLLINPDDKEAVKGLLPELASTTKGAKLEIAEDPTIERGGCILETGFGRINATIESQLATLQKELEAEFHARLDRSHAVVP
jgi:flagellar biosynthesis/type III secretory pathway protein FliH